MVSLSKLRKRSGLVIGGIGIAMLAFLLGDLLNSGNSLFSGTSTTIGKVNGQVIDYRDFELKAKMLDRISNSSQDPNSLRDNLWDEKVSEIIYFEQYDKLGINISSEELAGLTFGYNSELMSPTAKQFFGTSVNDISSQELASIIKQINENDPQRWLYFESIIRKERLFNKYLNLIKSGLNTSKSDIDIHFSEQSKKITGKYIYKPFDMSIEVSESEIKSYYNENRETYKQDEQREISIAIFDIIPTESDKNMIKNRLTDLIEDKKVFNVNNNNDIIPGFKSTKNVKLFVDKYSDKTFDSTYYAKGQLSPLIEEIMRSEKIGFVYGPYEENGSYKLARLNDIKSDSIQVAMIEMEIQPSEETSNEVYVNASEVALSKDFQSFELNAEKKNIAITSVDVKKNDKEISVLGPSRNLVFWAFNEKTSLNSIKLDDQNSRIVVSMLTNIVDNEYKTLDDVKQEIELEVKKTKSSRKLIAEFEDSLKVYSEFEILAEKMNLSIENTSFLNFSNNSIPTGFEPKVVGAFYGVEKNLASNPVVGESGVYLIFVDSVEINNIEKNYNSIRKQLDPQFQLRANYELNSALLDLADIDDDRSKFY
ncbi:MAG: hypothetical protein CBE48_003120 [Flavobacteriales bacterium TMED288]|nr:hypothetical protein [Flavobacteriales bacterium]RPG53086.1 MAG: hypothetical protein CBE48_003120 [Flavobacteriales bacterium TMED288]|tara:strand:- start:7029 stop:8813 length:1785 start_codon:yes stop_codon:yes gene_type:complete